MDSIVGVAQIILVGGVIFVFRTHIGDFMSGATMLLKSLAGLIDRDWKLKAPGIGEIEAKRAEAQQAITEDVRNPTLLPVSVDKPAGLPVALVPPANPPSTGTPAFNQLRAFLGDRTALLPEEERLKTALDALTMERLKFSHEFVYNRIFGSQLRALRQLVPLDQTTEADARRYFVEQVVTAAPAFYEGFTFERWLGFLVNTGLVDQEDGIIRINDFGKDFLHYLIIAKFPDNKPF